MSWWNVAVTVLVVRASIVQTTFAPNVTVLSCASRKVLVQLENAADDGLIFIQGRGLSCSQITVSETRKYEFDFELCNLQYDTKFRLVVQKKQMYQTGYDKVIPVMCIVDTSDLLVSGVVFPEEKLDNSALNKTVRPTVSMRVMAGQDGAVNAVEEVTLDDQIQLSLRLDDQYLQDFDIKVKECRAEMISLVENGCSKDEELFPNFEQKSKGDISSAFQAFQPTNLDGQTEVDVSFMCNVEVCKGECTKKICGEIVGWGRKKRNDNDEDSDDVYEKVTCATKLKVRSAPKDTGMFDGLQTEFEGKLCAEKVVIASVMAVTIFILTVSWIGCACVTSKLRRVNKRIDEPKIPNALRRLSESNIKFARSVGRRLSTILNLPVGYDVHDPKMMDSLQETEETPENKRRDSVTVSTDMNPENVNDNDSVVNENDFYVSDNGHIVNSNDKTTPLGVRKRFVNTSVQTDTNFDTVTLFTPKTDDKPKHNPLQPNTHPFSLITSMSIKSVALKPNSGDQLRTCTDRRRNVYGHVTGKDDDICKKSEEQIIKYSADDAPKARPVDNTINKNFDKSGIESTLKSPYFEFFITNSRNKPVSPPINNLPSPTLAFYKAKTVLHITASNSAANGVKENNSKAEEETDRKEGCAFMQNIGCLEQMEDSLNESDYEPITFRHPKFERSTSTHV